MVVFCRVAIRRKSCSNLHDGALQCRWMCEIFGQESRWGAVSLPFHMPTLGAQRLAKWLLRMRREDVRHCSSWLELVLRGGNCFEARSLLRRDYGRGDGSYMRKPGRTSKATAIPTMLAHTQCAEWRCSPSVSLAEAKRRARALEGICLCGLGHHIQSGAVRARVSSFSFSGQKRKWCANECVNGMRACVWLYMSAAKHKLCRQENNRQMSSMEEYPPFSGKIHTCFDGYPGRSDSQNINVLSMPHRGQSCPSTHAPTHRASTRTQGGGPFFAAAAAFFFFLDSMDFLLSLP